MLRGRDGDGTKWPPGRRPAVMRENTGWSPAGPLRTEAALVQEKMPGWGGGSSGISCKVGGSVIILLYHVQSTHTDGNEIEETLQGVFS